MIAAFAILLVLHGLIHLLGFAKAFGFAELPQLTQPVGPLAGAGWMLAALLFVAAAIALYAWPKGWWVLGAAGVAVSTLVIAAAWADARAGMLANIVVLAGVVFGFLAWGPTGLRAAFERDVHAALAERARAGTETVREEDLAHLPAPVRRYLQGVGVVGQPRVRNFHARMHGRIRSGGDARWMPLWAEQYNVLDPPARFFYLNASMFGLPVQGYHRYAGPSATMRIKAAALVPVVSAAGPEMDQSETVTLFNDLCVMAPATLIDPAIQWEPVSEGMTRAVFTNAGHTIRAELWFNQAGELTNFLSDDRYETTPDGRIATKARWSTPLSGYRRFGAVRLSSTGVGQWHDPNGDYSYIELAIDSVDYNLDPATPMN